MSAEQLDLLQWKAPPPRPKPVVYPLCPTRGSLPPRLDMTCQGCGRLELRCGCAAPPWQINECIRPLACEGMPAAGQHLLIIDGSALLHRYYFPEKQAGGQSRRRTKAGESVDALYWATRAIFQILGTVRPSHVAVVVDHPDGDEARRALHPSYRERKDKDPGFARQIELAVSKAWRALGLRLYQEPSCEGDDVIATLACRWPVSRQLSVCCWDKDLLPILDPAHHGPLRAIVQVEEGTIAIKDPSQVAHDRFGIACAQVADLLALAGDSADSLPGVPGIGKKTAAQLLTAHGSLWAIYRALDEDRLDLVGLRSGERIKELLRSHRNTAILTRRLVSLQRDVEAVPDDPIAFDALHRWTWVEEGDEAVGQALAELGMADLLVLP